MGSCVKDLIADGPVDDVDMIQARFAFRTLPQVNKTAFGVVGLALFLQVEAPVPARIGAHSGEVLPITPVAGKIIIEQILRHVGRPIAPV